MEVIPGVAVAVAMVAATAAAVVVEAVVVKDATGRKEKDPHHGNRKNCALYAAIVRLVITTML